MVNHQPRRQRGAQIWETICSGLLFGAGTAGSEIHILPFSIVLKLLLSRHHQQNKSDWERKSHFRLLFFSLQNTKNENKLKELTCSDYLLLGHKRLACDPWCFFRFLRDWPWPGFACRDQGVGAVSVFSAAVHVAHPVGALAVRTAFWVGARAHDDGRAQLGLTILYTHTHKEENLTLACLQKTDRQIDIEKNFKKRQDETFVDFTAALEVDAVWIASTKIHNITFKLVNFPINHTFLNLSPSLSDTVNSCGRERT